MLDEATPAPPSPTPAKYGSARSPLTERKAALFVDVAPAYVQWGRREQGLSALRTVTEFAATASALDSSPPLPSRQRRRRHLPAHLDRRTDRTRRPHRRRAVRQCRTGRPCPVPTLHRRTAGRRRPGHLRPGRRLDTTPARHRHRHRHRPTNRVPVEEGVSARHADAPEKVEQLTTNTTPLARWSQPCQTALTLQNSRMPCTESSRPYPLVLMPPNGSSG